MKDETEQLFESLHDELMQIDSKKQTISVSEFRKFLPLFQTFPNGKIPSTGSEDDMNYRQLSHEYSLRINIKKPVNLVDDSTGEVIVTLPPLFSETKLMSTDQIRKNENFHHEASHDFPGAADRAHKKLQAGFIISQEMSLDEIQAVRKAELHQELNVLRKLNPDKFAAIMTQFNISPDSLVKKQDNSEDQDDSDILEFVVDD